MPAPTGGTLAPRSTRALKSRRPRTSVVVRIFYGLRLAHLFEIQNDRVVGRVVIVVGQWLLLSCNDDKLRRACREVKGETTGWSPDGQDDSSAQ
jgi:hypothetical protein